MASEKITAIIEELKTLTVLELSELVHAVEDEFGVSAAAAVVAAGPVAAEASAAAVPVTSFVVTLPLALIFVTVSFGFAVADLIVKLFIITSPPS